MIKAAALPERLQVLNNQAHVHDRLDWWSLEDWCDSDALITWPAQASTDIAGAMLVVPIEFDEIHRLASARAQAAWLRWCAVADGQSPSALLHALLAQAETRLRSSPVRELWCVCEPHNWLGINLRDEGFKRRDELVTMTRVSNKSRKAVNWVMPKRMTLRVLHPACIDSDTLAQIHALDAAAFAPLWRYSAHMLRRSFLQSCYVTVAEQAGRIVGYQCAQHDGHADDSVAHITRLVVHPAVQRGGVGAALFGNVVGELLNRGACEITLNTPASNVGAQRLYKQFGFTPLAERVAVWCKTLV